MDLSQDPIIDLKNVTMAYGGPDGVVALAEASLQIEMGEFVAVVGPSGCGKSSLLKLIAGLHPPQSGAVCVQGRPVTGPLKICGMAFQNSMLLPWRTAIENVLLPLEIVASHAGRYRQNREEYRKGAMELLATVGLSGFEDKYSWQLSGGMQQRASLCRALIHAPELLLLDEPFGALDPFTREELWDVLQALWQERRPTVILVTHDLREAIFLADTIYVISHRPGRVISKTRVELPRPRQLEDTFKPAFIELSHSLREQIGVSKRR